MKISLQVLLLMCALLMSGCAFAWEKVSNPQIAFILGGVKVEAEKEFKNFAFRALSVREDGECDGKPSTCPKLHYYLVVSTIDEDPDQAVYELDPSQDWQISNIEEVDSYGEYQRYLIVTLKRTIPSDDISRDWWKVVEYKVKLNPWEFNVIEGKGIRPDQAK